MAYAMVFVNLLDSSNGDFKKKILISAVRGGSSTKIIQVYKKCVFSKVKLYELTLELPPHLLYSPDLDASDYFHSLKNDLAERGSSLEIITKPN